MNRRLRRTLVGLALVGLLTTAITGAALAATSAKTYTGCLTVSGGTLILIKEGQSPQKPCPSGTVLVRFAEGDITSITAGTGLAGGATSGDATLSITPTYRLPQGCSQDQIVVWAGTAWACGDDANTTYTGGTGIQVSGTQISLDPAYRLPAAAQGDSVMKTGSGTWTTEQFTRAGEGCSSGQFVTGTTAGGGVSCAAPPSAPSGLGAAYYATGGAMLLGGTMDVLTLDLPAGSYLLFANVTVIQRDADTGSAAACYPGNGIFEINAREGQNGEFTGSGTGAYANHPGGPLALRCQETSADVDIVRAQFYALRVTSFNAP